MRRTRFSCRRTGGKRHRTLKSAHLIHNKETETMKDETKRLLRSQLENCRLCPRECGVNRKKGEKGFCRQSLQAAVSHALPHFGEEPPISGTGGSGTVFFQGCTLRCVYCQNHQISFTDVLTPLSREALTETFLSLQLQGCHNINLVTPTPHIPALAPALTAARKQGLTVPVIYNTNSYLTEEALEILDGLVDIYLADIRYADDESALRYSSAPRYAEKARAAFLRMVRQQPRLVLDGEGIARRGVILRLLILPHRLDGAEQTLNFLRSMGIRRIGLSVMSQYGPAHRAKFYEKLRTPIDRKRYEAILDLAESGEFAEAWFQEYGCADSCIPDFTRQQPFLW